MLQLDPTNKKLLFAVISANLGSGQIDLAKHLIPVLRNSLEPEERYKLRILQYKIYMLQQQDIHDENKSIKIKKKMKKLLDEVAQSGEFQEKNAFVWYRYALAKRQHSHLSNPSMKRVTSMPSGSVSISPMISTKRKPKSPVHRDWQMLITTNQRYGYNHYTISIQRVEMTNEHIEYSKSLPTKI